MRCLRNRLWSPNFKAFSQCNIRAGAPAESISWMGRGELTILTRHPQHVALAVVVEVARQHEEVVGDAVGVFERARVERLVRCELADQALGAADDRPREVEMRGRGSAAGQ